MKPVSSSWVKNLTGQIHAKAAEVLDNFGVAYEKKVVSAHRTPNLMFKHAEEARSRGIKVIIAGAGGAALARDGRS